MKKSLLIAFGLNMTGALSFAAFPFYGTALAALFILGIGMAEKNLEVQQNQTFCRI